MDENDKKKLNIEYILIALVCVVIIIVVILLLPKNSKETDYIKYAKMYVQKYNVSSPKFISIYEMEEADIHIFAGCNKATGVLYDNGSYEEYIECNDYYSENIKKLESSNKYLELIGSTFYVTNDKNYKDQGYILKDQTYTVDIFSNFEAKPGLYSYIYSVQDNNGNVITSLVRKVLFTEYNQMFDGKTIVLSGTNPYYVARNSKYQEPGYSLYDIYGENQTSRIEVIGTVNTRVPGEYKLTYKLNQIETERIVIVVDLETAFTDNQEVYSKDTYEIQLNIKGNDYSSTRLPNGNTTGDRNIKYPVSNNSTYTFIVNDKYGNQIALRREVKSIDKEGPTGTCANKLDLGKTYVTVDGNDDLSGINYYIYSNGESEKKSTNATYTYSGLYKNVDVTLVDKVGNETKIKCVSSGEGAEAQIKPPSGANIIKTADSDTLKITIESTSNYYITRMWILDPYNQIKKEINKWGSSLMKPSKILEKAVSNNNLEDKIAVAVNGSGFYLLGSWEPSCSSSCRDKYNKTTEGGLVIYDGTVLRNWYEDTYVDKARNHATYAISKAGNLDIYYNYNSLSQSARKDLFDDIIKKGYLNTWTFRPAIMENGKVLSSDVLGTFLNSKAMRTIFCQVNHNNYVFLTSKSNQDINDIKKILTELNCQAAANLDGGGSRALIYKPKNGSIEIIAGDGRSVVDIVYVTEK